MVLPSAEAFSIVSVEDRAWTRRVPELDMWCDDREILTNLPDTYNEWWGAIYMRQDDPQPSNDAPEEVSARVALAVGDGRLIGIISPYEAREPAIWFSVALADIGMVEVLARHRPTGRPRRISISVPGWSLVFATIARHDGSREWRGQELSLLRALGGPTPWRTRWAVIRRMYVRPWRARARR